MRVRVFGRDSLALVTAVVLAGVSAREASAVPYEGVCAAEFEAATREVGSVRLPDSTGLTELSRAVDTAMVKFRFHQLDAAVARLDRGVSRQPGPWSHDVPAGKREHERVTAAMALFRNCIASAHPPEMAKLTVRAFELDPLSPGYEGTRPSAGAYLRVEGVPVGRAGVDGTLTVAVPSGEVRVTAVQPSSSIAHETVTLTPGGSGTAGLRLDGDKEVTEDADLVLLETADGILPARSPTVTLQFVNDDEIRVPVTALEEVALLNAGWDIERELEDLFSVADGAIVARDAAAVFKALGDRIGAVAIKVVAEDAAGFTYENNVRFHLGRSRLVVTLAPPPSNPNLSVANVEVHVTLMGTAVEMRRVSDANGRFEIESLPYGNIAFDSEVVSGGFYYYGQAMMALRGDRVVTLVMLNVKDIVNGVPALR